jgi:soluble lytic murein transglycosylase
MRAGLVAVGLLCILPAAPAAAQGGLYRFVDARGVVHFTNRPTDGRFEQVRAPKGFGRSRGGVVAVHTFDPLIAEASRQHGVPPALVKAVIHAESAFDPRAVSRKGAMGLMQLMPDTARSLGVREPFAAAQNVLAGTRYLRRLHDRYGSWTFTLAAYNAGPGAVDRYRGVPPYGETRQYVTKVLSYYRRYHGDFPR